MLTLTHSTVRTGADRLLEQFPELIKGRRIGILTNHTGRLSDGTPLIDAIVRSDIAKVKALFGPEHGLSGNTPDGNAVEHTNHPVYNVPVYSLYGKTHKPTPVMLRDIDAIVCDIQDVGARFYTYVSTVALALEAAAEAGLPFVLLDRPNPIRGLTIGGPVRVPQLRAFVSWMPLPITHGMTIGELAWMWNAEGWLAEGVKADLDVVPLDGWRRTMWFDETQLPWVSPSPNLPRLATATIYPGQCLFEGTSISEGRGTDAPFECVGAPWADPDQVMKEFEGSAVPGVTLSPVSFKPVEIPNVAKKPKYEGETCRGVRVTVTDRDALDPVLLGVSLLSAFKRAHPREAELRLRRFDILSGNASVRKMIDAGQHPAEIVGSWRDELEAFDLTRRRHLMYPS